MQPVNKRAYRERLLLAVLSVLTALVIAGHLLAYFQRGFVPEDFGAFYCAGKVVAHHQDPYRVEPLLDCERNLAAVDPRWKTILSFGVNGAPLPGYDFIPLAALAELPVRFAVMTFALLLIGATALIAYCLARMSPLPLVVAVAVSFMGVTYTASALGQLAPLAVAAVAASALLLRLGKERWAAAAAFGSLLQPQFGIPVLIALFLFVARARLILAVLGAVVLLCNLAAVGVVGTLEYPSVLSVHARSELNSPYQYSLTWLLHAFGSDARTALVMGTVSYIVLVTICLIILRRNPKRSLETGAIVLLPAAFGIFGGTSIHSHQMSVALLAAVTLVNPASLIATPMLNAALLAVPVGAIHVGTAIPSFLLAIAVAWCVAYFPARAYGMTMPEKRATVTAAVVTILFIAPLLLRPAHGTEPQVVPIVHHPNALSSLEDQAVYDAMGRNDRSALPYFVLLKIPAWLGVALTLWLASRELMNSPAGEIPAAWDRPLQKTLVS